MKVLKYLLHLFDFSTEFLTTIFQFFLLQGLKSRKISMNVSACGIMCTNIADNLDTCMTTVNTQTLYYFFFT